MTLHEPKTKGTILDVAAAKNRFLFTFPRSEELVYFWWTTKSVGAQVYDTNSCEGPVTASTVGNNAIPTETISLFGYPGAVDVFNSFLGKRRDG